MAERRRRLLVDKFQYTILMRVVVYWLVYQVTLWNFLFCWRLIQEGRGNLWYQLADFWRESYPMLYCFVALVPAFGLDAVKLCHRFSGPIHRFRATARAIAAGQPVPPIRLRKGDELGDLAADFNRMLHALAQRGAIQLADPRRGSEHDRRQDEGMARFAAAERPTAAAPASEEACHARQE